MSDWTSTPGGSAADLLGTTPRTLGSWATPPAHDLQRAATGLEQSTPAPAAPDDPLPGSGLLPGGGDPPAARWGLPLGGVETQGTHTWSGDQGQLSVGGAGQFHVDGGSVGVNGTPGHIDNLTIKGPGADAFLGGKVDVTTAPHGDLAPDRASLGAGLEAGVQGHGNLGGYTVTNTDSRQITTQNATAGVDGGVGAHVDAHIPLGPAKDSPALDLNGHVQQRFSVNATAGGPTTTTTTGKVGGSADLTVHANDYTVKPGVTYDHDTTNGMDTWNGHVTVTGPPDSLGGRFSYTHSGHQDTYELDLTRTGPEEDYSGGLFYSTSPEDDRFGFKFTITPGTGGTSPKKDDRPSGAAGGGGRHADVRHSDLHALAQMHDARHRILLEAGTTMAQWQGPSAVAAGHPLAGQAIAGYLQRHAEALEAHARHDADTSAKVTAVSRNYAQFDDEHAEAFRALEGRKDA